MNRLWVRLSLAFAMVTLVSLGAVAVLANRQAGEAFRTYLSFSGSSRHEPVVESLVAYYTLTGSWTGVEILLEHASAVSGSTMSGGPGMTFPRESRLDLVLADLHGVVLYDAIQHRPGRTLTREEAATARPITVNGQMVGQLAVALPIRSAVPGPLEQGFFDRLRQALLAGAGLAAVVGGLLGLAFSRSLSSPLQRLASAARAVAGRDFSHRVQVGGSSEVAAVSQAFNDMTEALEQSEELRKNLIADVAHELRTPLTVLQGNLQAIIDDVYTLDKSEISLLYDQTRLLSRLVEDLRQLALADAGRLPMNLQPTDVAQILHNTHEHFQPLAEARGVVLTVHTPDSLPRVQADQDRVAQVLHNLLSNALRSTPAGGSVTMTATAAREGLEVIVRDTGSGISAQDLPHIFDRFWRADHSRARDEHDMGGTGLGLSIAQSLVRAHGGRIWAESTPGQGSAFHFTLPAAEDLV